MSTDVTETIDPLFNGCGECGAASQVPCEPNCTAWPSALIAADMDDATPENDPAARLAVAIALELRTPRTPEIRDAGTSREQV